MKDIINVLPSAEAAKKKAKLKENGDWDCPDVDCEECDHYRSVDWCSLAISNHEEIDDTYMMVNEAFFEGFEAAEKQYRLLIETIEELDEKSVGSNFAEPKTGEWKPKNHHTDYCSNCGFEETQWRTADYNFCPSCGAKIKGEDDEYTF